MHQSSYIRLITVFIFILMAVAPQFVPALRPLLLMSVAMGLCAIGVLLLLRAGQVSFGHALYFACGAYVVAFGTQSRQADLLLLLIAAVVVSLLLGALLGAVLVRYRGIFYGMLNLAFSMVGFTLLMRLYSLTGGSDGMPVRLPLLLGKSFDAVQFNWVFYYFALVMLAVVFWLINRYLNSPPGHGLLAVKTNETRLEYLGISAHRVFFVGHVVSAGLAGLGGAVAAFATGHVTPDLAYWSLSAEFVFIAVLGGIGNIAGALSGAIAFELIRSYASAYAINAWQLIMGAVLVAMVMFAPHGIWGLIERVLRRTNTSGVK